MFVNSRKLQIAVLTLLVYFAFTISANAQSPCSGVEMPAGTLCITQAAGNAAAENRRELDATKEKVIVLTDALTEKDRIIADVRATAGKNEADLKEALTRTQTELATKTGQLVGCETMNVRQTAIIEVLLKHVRPKKIGIINF